MLLPKTAADYRSRAAKFDEQAAQARDPLIARHLSDIAKAHRDHAERLDIVERRELPDTRSEAA
jgi:hypothetical protein